MITDESGYTSGFETTPSPVMQMVGSEKARDDVNDPYPGYFVSGVDDEGRDILSPALSKETQP